MPYSDPEKAKAYYQAYYLANRERIKAATTAYAKAHVEECRARRRAYLPKYLAARPHIVAKRLEDKRKWYCLNKARVFKWQLMYRAKKRASDPRYLSEVRLRNSLSAVVKACVKSQSTKVVTLIGCSKLQLRAHIESLWITGMSWSNYGVHGWHVDHKLTCSKFDLLNPAEVERCFHFTNLQPLWATDNLKKGAT